MEGEPLESMCLRRYVYSPHQWPLLWPSTNGERDGPPAHEQPLETGFDTRTHTHTHTHAHTHTHVAASRRSLAPAVRTPAETRIGADASRNLNSYLTSLRKRTEKEKNKQKEKGKKERSVYAMHVCRTNGKLPS